MKLQFPKHPIHLRSQSGFILMLFTLCMACSLWLMLILDTKEAQVGSKPVTLTQQIIAKYGPPKMTSDAVTHNDAFSSQVDKTLMTSVIQVSGTLTSIDTNSRILTLSVYDRSGKNVASSVQVDPNALIAVIPTDIHAGYTAMPLNKLATGMYIDARGAKQSTPFKANLLLLPPQQPAPNITTPPLVIPTVKR